ncbi:ABC transporter ATP-binding protein [Sphingomonas sp. NCPPB 2930]|uniref:ABC transporter ATP-binding protein n=1 Tax=Sphingomonas sp. NCPPB 2930 TaxID=3162788 RepID=UPI0036DA1515
MTGVPLARIDHLRITAVGEDGREIVIVPDVSLSITKGEVLALIGESGSGKTTIALSLLGYARPGCRIAGGVIEVAGHRLDGATPEQLRQVRGRTVAYVAQSAAAAFNPSLTIMAQVIEPALIHGTLDRAAAEDKAKALFRRLALPDPDGVGARYPHQVSGGQLQRLMAAMALITDPALVIFDEPTTALDVTTQIEVLKAFKDAVRDLGTTAVYVTHDLSVVAQIADRIAVLRGGEVQELGTTRQILFAPRHSYAQALVAAAAPRACVVPPPTDEAPLLDMWGIVAGYGGTGPDGAPRTKILDGIDVSIRRGQVLGVIGESGCGKSTLARVAAGLHAPSAGRILLNGHPLAPLVRHRSRDELRRVQMVFQSADTALNPSVSIGAAIARPLAFYHGLERRSAKAEVARLLDLVRLPASLADRLPGELSGGQKQRANLARALAARPDLLLCDEVTSALDPVIAEAVLDLLVELRRELGLAYMFITHDLEIVRAIADDVLVLYAGRVAEQVTRDGLGHGAHHPYTRLLTASVPELRPGWLEETPARQAGAAGARMSATGCSFHPRCIRANTSCVDTMPPRLLEGDRQIFCHQSLDLLATP